ncbi:Cytosol aminopeptidase [Cucumispora dikerogammari]|nr:Cytosol aminopeptidase [Cucumispora dikerogammari]
MPDYKSLFEDTFKNVKQEGKTMSIVCFNSTQNSDGTYSILSNINKEQADKYINFLKETGVEKEASGVYIIEDVALVGLKLKSNPEFNVRIAAGAVFKALKLHSVKNFNFPDFEFVKFLREGLILASYKFDIKTLTFQPSYYFEGPESEIFTVKAQNFSRFLMDIPSNLLKPADFSEIAKNYIEFLTKFNKEIKIEIFDEEFMKEKKMGLLLSVNAGSHQPAKLIKITYMGSPNKATYDYSLVGKGVTFDTGGISLKPSLNMHHMKSDMGGAGTCLASLGPIVQQKVSINLTMILPMVTNMPGGNATKPGDVICAMNGKFVEILNTDAEGRLILADALTFAQEDKPKKIIDLATLTGAICVALGDNYQGFFSNDEKFAKSFKKACKNVSEFMWQMPLNDDAFFNTSESAVADFANIGASRLGGSSAAASFLQQFIDEGTPWIHVDMASSMDAGAAAPIYGKGSSGRPTLALVELLKEKNE